MLSDSDSDNCNWFTEIDLELFTSCNDLPNNNDTTTTTKKKYKNTSSKKEILSINNEKITKPFSLNLYETRNVCDYTTMDNFIKDNLLPYTKNVEQLFFNIRNMKLPLCYICKKRINQVHWFYLYQCPECGEKSIKRRYITRNLTGYNALVTGGRVKLGYQIALKLLRAGANVMITTRNIKKALEFYALEPDYNIFGKRLHVFPQSFDLGIAKDLMVDLIKEIDNIFGKNKLDILIQNAAQTIYESGDPSTKIVDLDTTTKPVTKRKRVTYPPFEWRTEFEEKYDRKIDCGKKNTWGKTIYETSDEEIITVIQNNIIGTILIDKYIIPEMRKSEDTYVVHVHAKEGLLSCHKTGNHLHTNIAKAGLHMITRCLSGDGSIRESRDSYPQIHGVNPGWFSIDEYTMETRQKHRIYHPPIDEIDAASRIVYPIFCKKKSFHKTWSNYKKMENY